MDIFWTIYTFIIGICIGSFLNVVVLRGLSGESIVLPPSHCTKCDHKLAWYDNIPVLSYLLLRGKCRYCDEKISPQYPIVELVTGLIFTGIFYKYGLSTNMFFLMAAAALCIVIAVTDIKEKVILDGHAYLLMILGLVYNFFNFAGENSTKISFWIFGAKISIYQAFIHSILGLVGGFGVMCAIAFISKLITKKDCFGEGDAYILGALGAFWGITNAIVILILSIFVWGGMAIPVFLFKWFKEKNYKIFAAMSLFIVATTLFLVGEHFGAFESNLFHWFAYILVASTGLYSCKLVLNSIKTGTQLTVIPYGPALIFGAFVVLFLL